MYIIVIIIIIVVIYTSSFLTEYACYSYAPVDMILVFIQ